jgi:hypothetical protein
VEAAGWERPTDAPQRRQRCSTIDPPTKWGRVS